MSWTLEFPYPPSGNHRNKIGKRGVYRPVETQAYFDDVWATCREQNAPQRLSARLSVTFTIQAPDARRRDLDNAAKTLSDAITEAGVWIDDYQIDALQLLRGAPVRGGRVLVQIQEIA